MSKKRNNAISHNFYLPVPDDLLPLGNIVDGIISSCIKDILFHKTDTKQEPDYCHSCFESIFEWYSSVKTELSDEYKYELTLYTLDCLDNLFSKNDDLLWYFDPRVTTTNVTCRLYRGYIKVIVHYFYNEIQYGREHHRTGTYV